MLLNSARVLLTPSRASVTRRTSVRTMASSTDVTSLVNANPVVIFSKTYCPCVAEEAEAPPLRLTKQQLLHCRQISDDTVGGHTEGPGTGQDG